MILAIETSTQECSVAILDQNEIIATAHSTARTHSEKLITLIDAVLGDAETTLAGLDGIAIGAGPGSFTGLRIGMATVKGLCFAANKPMWAVSSLAALALEAGHHWKKQETPFVAVLDAHRKEVFAAVFVVRESGLVRLSDEIAIVPDQLYPTFKSILFNAQGEQTHDADIEAPWIVGAGAELYRQQFELTFWFVEGAPLVPRAASVARLAMTCSPEASLANAAPVYIRKSEAEIRYPDGNPGGSYAPIQK